jgi:hypothetical protein
MLREGVADGKEFEQALEEERMYLLGLMDASASQQETLETTYVDSLKKLAAKRCVPTIPTSRRLTCGYQGTGRDLPSRRAPIEGRRRSLSGWPN